MSPYKQGSNLFARKLSAIKRYKDLEKYFKEEDAYKDWKAIPRSRELKEFNIPCVYKHDFFYALEVSNPFQSINKGSLEKLLKENNYLYLGEIGGIWCLYYNENNKEEFSVNKDGKLWFKKENPLLVALEDSSIIEYIYSKVKTNREISSIIINRIGTELSKLIIGYSLVDNNCLRVFVCVG